MTHPTRLAWLVLLTATGCAHSVIEGTQVIDTPDNRSVMSVLGKLRDAMQQRNAEALIALVSTKYFEDMGTATPEDDYGFEELRSTILPKSMEVTKELYLDFQVHEVVVEGDVARADLRYASRARLELPAGTLWDSHHEFNRVEFTRENGGWRITRGL